MSVSPVTAKRLKRRICTELQQTCITKIKLKVRTGNGKQEFVFIPGLSTNCYEMAAPSHSHACSACPDARGFQDFLLPTTPFPHYLSELAAHPCQLLCPHYDMEKRRNHVIHYDIFFHGFCSRRDFAYEVERCRYATPMTVMNYYMNHASFTVLATNRQRHSREVYTPSSSPARSPKARIFCSWNSCK